MLWIKEVEMVESVDDLKSSCSVRGIRTPDFEVLDAKIASALIRIIHNTRFKRRISLEEQKGPKNRTVSFAEDRIAYANDSVENYADPFTIGHRNDDIQEFDSKWEGILWSMTKIPSDDILVRIVQVKNTRVWETQDRIGIVQNGDSPEESWTWLSQMEDTGEKM